MSATVRYIRKRAFSPVVTGSLLYILTRGPESLRRPLVNILSSPANVERAKSVLKWLFALGLLGRLNSWLNSWAENGWQLYGDKKRWNWNKEIAVITGGSNGIGAGVVKGLAAKGIKCVVLDVEDLPKNMQNYANINFYKCDITSPSAVSEVASEIRSKIGNPTILVNNAGIGTSHTILLTEPEYLERLFSINVFAHYNTLQAFLPSMISANKGHVVTVASLSSFVPPVGLVHYASTKAAVMSLHEGLTSELRHLYNAPNVKTSIVHPTYARTRLLEGFEKEVKENKGVVIDPKLISDAIVRQILSGRGARVVVPQGMSLAKAIRGMPSWMQERLRDSLAPHTQSAKDMLLKR
ncbi:dehydrogenase/reductase SDR family member 8 precursor [Viridothelium virens]|uniref:Short-chain dehydrogenase/reductase 3 n=1 Tax=Viridothelium virens TaxID=1048519 RepID=A0A6A6HJU0_VIRVR|nr:dehydrogenase/reductase SDR family member 8 precursor [Viridothelium virens]